MTWRQRGMRWGLWMVLVCWSGVMAMEAEASKVSPPPPDSELVAASDVIVEGVMEDQPKNILVEEEGGRTWITASLHVGRVLKGAVSETLLLVKYPPRVRYSSPIGVTLPSGIGLNAGQKAVWMLAKQVKGQGGLRYGPILEGFHADRSVRSGQEGETLKRLVDKVASVADLGIEWGDPQALRVKAVRPDSPASAANLKSGDEIKVVRDQEMASQGEWWSQLAACQPDERVALRVRRGKEDLALQLALPSMPDSKIIPEWKARAVVEQQERGLSLLLNQKPPYVPRSVVSVRLILQKEFDSQRPYYFVTLNEDGRYYNVDASSGKVRLVNLR